MGLKPRPTHSLQMLQSELIRKIDNANEKYGVNMLTIGQWSTAIARACEGAVEMAFQMGSDFGFQKGQDSERFNQEGSVKRCI